MPLGQIRLIRAMRASSSSCLSCLQFLLNMTSSLWSSQRSLNCLPATRWLCCCMCRRNYYSWLKILKLLGRRVLLIYQCAAYQPKCFQFVCLNWECQWKWRSGRYFPKRRHTLSTRSKVTRLKELNKRRQGSGTKRLAALSQPYCSQCAFNLSCNVYSIRERTRKAK